MPGQRVLLLLAAAVFVMSASVVRALRRWLRRQVLDIPSARSSHTVPTPRGGGLAIVSTTMLTAGMSWSLLRAGDDLRLPLALVGAALIAVVSWFDDQCSLSWQVRLLAHAVAAMVLIISVGPVSTVPIPLLGPWQISRLLGVALSILWMVGLTNAYNFMDGIDGIAAGQAIVAGAGWAILGWSVQEATLALAGLVLAAASAGFLLYNWPPASIFMGDIGSAFLGYSFAALTLLAARDRPILLWCGFLLVWPFIFDTTLTFFRRLLQGEHVFSAHRSHFYQRLVITGMTHGQVSSLYLGAATVGTAAAVALERARWTAATLLIAAIFAIGAGIYALVIWREAHRPRASPQWPPASRVSDRTAC